jgi:FAD:protein FMN transferase
VEAETRFRAMGTDVHVVVVDMAASLLPAASVFVAELESRWSRFLGSSEISVLNAMAGTPVRVSPATLTLVERAFDGARLTSGRFDPTVLGAVVRAGYDRTFELIPSDAPPGTSLLRGGWERIVVDRAASTIEMPEGVGFDPGGIGKGLAADLLAARLLDDGAAGVCVNIGGDLTVAGEAPGGGSWAIGVEHPLRRERAALIALQQGALATSMRTKRTLGPASEGRHHLIDPVTGEPARTGVASVSAIAVAGWQAEVLAKAAFVAGVADGLALLESLGADGLIVDDLGAIRTTLGFDRFTRSAEPRGWPTAESDAR